MLWHSNIQTTINVYASKFDESAALNRVEEYREQRTKQSAAQPQGAAKTSVGTTSAVVSKAPVTKAQVVSFLKKAPWDECTAARRDF